MKRSKNIRGFTLIELLVVIAIIGLLSSVVLGSLNSARGKANDARRLSDMRTLQTSLDLYLLQNNSYPSLESGVCGGPPGGWTTSGNDSNFVNPLVVGGFLGSPLKDPVPALENDCGNYAYFRYPAGQNGCPVSRGAFYVIGVRSTYTSGLGTHPRSPGFSCVGRDWGGEFSWVTGRFQN